MEFCSERRGKQRGGFWAWCWKKLIYYVLLSLKNINGHHTINVLKVTCHFTMLLLDCWLSLLRWLSLLLWKYLCKHSMCVVLDVFRPQKRLNQRLEEMLRLGLGWVLASCSWLSSGFWKPPSKKPCPGLVYPIILFNSPTEGLALQRWRHILQLPQALAKFAVANHHIWSYTAIDKFAVSGFVPPSIGQC